MNVLWIVNIELPAISERRGRTINPLGGWLTGVLNRIKDDKDIQLSIAYPDSNCTGDYEKGVIFKNVNYISFREFRTTKNNYPKVRDILKRIVDEVNPDIIHIHGTEYMHSSALAEVTYGDIPTAISIQGILTPYYYYYYGIPGRIKYKVTLHSLLKRNFLLYGVLSLKKRCKYEQKALLHTDYVIGRTDWDRAYTSWLAPQAKYMKCNETLRDSFYDTTWKFETCEKDTLLASQSDSPIKGFHFLLRAIALVKKQRPDVKVYAVGTEKNPAKLPNCKKLNVYQQYIYKLIKDYHLEKNVVFLGRLDEKEMVAQMVKANVFICPSSCENSPNSLGEAMLLGVPCIASDVGGISSLISNHVEGIVYRCDDISLLAYYIIMLFKDKELAIRLGASARRRALITHDSIENYRQLRMIYNEMFSLRKV